MNTLISNPKAQFLLGAGLDVLHHESTEWLETIAFWEDEMKFFNKLLHGSEPLEESLKGYKEMLENLEKIQSNIFPIIRADVMDHERLLARSEQNKERASDDDYRKMHLQIKDRMETMRINFKVFKKTVFGYYLNL